MAPSGVHTAREDPPPRRSPGARHRTAGSGRAVAGSPPTLLMGYHVVSETAEPMPGRGTGVRLFGGSPEPEPGHPPARPPSVRAVSATRRVRGACPRRRALRFVVAQDQQRVEHHDDCGDSRSVPGARGAPGGRWLSAGPRRCRAEWPSGGPVPWTPAVVRTSSRARRSARSRISATGTRPASRIRRESRSRSFPTEGDGRRREAKVSGGMRTRGRPVGPARAAPRVVPGQTPAARAASYTSAATSISSEASRVVP